MIRQQEDELELELPFSEEELKEKYEKFSISLIFYYTEDLIPISCRWTFYTPPQIWWRAGERHGRPHFPAFVQDDEGELGLGYFHAFSILLAIVCFCHTIVRYLNCHLQVLVKRKITVPGSFIGHSTTPAVSCSYKVVENFLPLFVNFPFAQAASGFIYPLERGMIFIYKPPIFVKYEDIQSINFARYLYLKCTGGKWQILVLFVAYFSSLRFSGQAEPTDHLILR